MQGKAYNKEIDAENWAVSMDLYRLSSILMPELQWLSGESTSLAFQKPRLKSWGWISISFSYPNKSCFCPYQETAAILAFVHEAGVNWIWIYYVFMNMKRRVAQKVADLKEVVHHTNTRHWVTKLIQKLEIKS